MTNRYILAIDPSGNFTEGKGTTGWVLLDTKTDKPAKFGMLKAEDYKNTYEYWDAHIKLIDDLAGYHPAIVIEEFRLYHNRAANQINSLMETPRLIGVLTLECYKRNYWFTLQSAASVMTRWSDKILEHKGYLTKKGRSYMINGYIVPDHVKDALRHAVHVATFRRNDGK